MHGLVPCCGQDGYRAQVPQQPKESYNIYLSIIQYAIPVALSGYEGSKALQLNAFYFTLFSDKQG